VDNSVHASGVWRLARISLEIPQRDRSTGDTPTRSGIPESREDFTYYSARDPALRARTLHEQAALHNGVAGDT
jgi:hypothetical protein